MIPYFELFQYLIKNPMANFSQISKAISVSDKTAKSHFLFLQRNNYIKGVQAMYDPEAIGLNTRSYLIKIDTFNKIPFLEKLGDYHNFTVYRNRIYGNFNGMLMQFNVPPNANQTLDKLFQSLKELEIIEDFKRILPTHYKTKTKPNLKFFNNELGYWKWDYNSWFEKLHNASEKPKSSIKKTECVQKRLTELDVKLLRQLTINARRPNLELSKELQTSNAQISRRKSFLEDKVIDEYRLIYSRDKIQFLDYVLFKCHTSQKNKFKLLNLLLTESFPFDSGFELTKEGFVWRINLPPAFTAEIASFLWSISEKLEYYRIDALHSMLYWFYDKNFDPTKKEWIASEKEILEDPLNWVEKNYATLAR